MRVLSAVAIVTVTAFLIYMGLDAAEDGADASSLSMDEMSIDMNPAGNTGTSIGSRQFCARIDENNILDADEEATDTVELDVTVLNIPAGNPAIATTFRLHFPAPNQMTVTQVGVPYAAANAWSSLNISDPAQSDGDYSHDLIDTQAAGTSGSGTISNLTLQTMSGASTGVFPLTLTAQTHIDTGGKAQTPNTINHGWIAIDEACPSGEPSPPPTPTPSSTPILTPTPTPTPVPTVEPTPGPTGTPSGEPVVGDIDCDGNVDAVDALAILRFVGGITDELVACAQPAGALSGGAVLGDVDCDGSVDAVDALAILRFVGGFLDELVAC